MTTYSQDDSAGAARIQPVTELFRSNVVAFWATTYNIDLALFNEFLLGRLGEPPLNIAILADADRVAATLARIPSEKVDQVALINSRWLLRSGPSGNGRFHPKSYLAVTPTKATLLVGSGNLSASGLDEGREVFTAFVSGTPDGDDAIDVWRTWIRRLVQRVDDTRLAERFAELESRLPKPVSPRITGTARVLHNLDEALADQLVATVMAESARVDDLIVTAPFFDRNGIALTSLIERLSPQRVTLYMTTATSVDGVQLATALQTSGADVKVWLYEPDRFTHAKVIGAIAGSRGWILSGSANLSRAALTMTAGTGNVELSVITPASPSDVWAAFLPPDAATRELSFADLLTLEYATEADGDAPSVRLLSAVAIADGRIDVVCEPTLQAGWRLGDLATHSALVVERNATRTVGPLPGRLVQIESGDGTPLSNRIVVDDPKGLDAALRVRARTGGDQPIELHSGDLDTAVGKALVYLHRNLIMDVTEAAPGGAGSGGVGADESDSVTDDDLWERLEREQLGRDPRANNYGRLLGQPAGLGVSEPILELLEAMRDRAPTQDRSALASTSDSVLRLLRLQAEEDDDADDDDEDQDTADAPRRRWKPETRVRVRARNVLRRWAAAQNDPRLIWIDHLAPAVNFSMVATTFARLWLAVADDPDRCELRATDLADLWFAWMRPFVGSGRGDGWLDQLDLKDDAVRGRLPASLAETVAALSWLTVRRRDRDTTIAWQPVLSAALDRALLEPTEEAARFVSHVVHARVERSRVEEDLLQCIEFIDDDLWCERTRLELALDALRLDVGSTGQAVSVRLHIRGVNNPLTDPRLPQLIVATRRYRRCDGLATFSDDEGWRLVVTTGQPVAYLAAGHGQELVESAVVEQGALEAMAAASGILSDLFARAAVA